MQGFLIRTDADQTIRFRFYFDSAPVTSEAFAKTLPFSRNFYHARVSGHEIWVNDAPGLDIIQENASVFTEPGEIVIGPIRPARTKTSKCMGIYYDDGKGLDSCNIFGKVFEEDFTLLKNLGDQIWRSGSQTIRFENFEYGD